MAPLRCKVTEGQQDETALLHAWMGQNRDFRAFSDEAVIVQEVQIDGPGRVPHPPITCATKLSFNLM